jgi:hypothetical protein
MVERMIEIRDEAAYSLDEMQEVVQANKPLNIK